MERISRKEAKLKGFKTYFTGKPCKHGHISIRRIDNRCCDECSKGRSNEWKSNNKDYMSNYNKDYYWKDPDRHRERVNLCRKNNPNLAKKKDQIQREKHYIKRIANVSKRRAAKIKRTPLWLTKENLLEIESLYKKSTLFTKYCGEQYHVDHTIPLQGKLVSGLHVPSNLRVVRSGINLSKGNTYEIQ